MNRQDKQRVQMWLESGASLHEVLNTPRNGLVENVRFSEAAVRLFSLIYKWSSFKFSEDYPDSMDYAAIMKRVARCKKLVQTHLGVTIP